MIYEGHNYRLVIGNIGATLTRKADGASRWFQGDDSDELASQMDALDATAEKGYPIGPFSSYESHIDAILDAYDDVLEVL